MFYVRPACICVMILAMSGSACRHPDRKHDPSAQRKADVDTATNLSRIEIPPDLRAFFDGNHLYMSQHFDVTGGGKQVVVAQGGLKITVDPSCLEYADGSSPKGDIHVRIVELRNSRDFFRHNMATVSNGRLLMSGGSYFIGMSSGGRELQIRKGKTLQTQFPKLVRDEMELFYGNRDSLGNMNWARAGLYLEDEDQVERVDFTETAPAKNTGQDLLSAFGRRIFRTMNAPVYYYNQRMSLADLLDTINRRRQVLCLDSISFWPKNLPTGVTLDTNYLVYLYGPRYQFMVRRCNCAEDSVGLSAVKTMTRKDSAMSLAERLANYYAPAEIGRLGWINCDRFYKTERPVEMYVDLPPYLQRSCVSYFLIFRGFNGLLNGRAITDSSGSFALQDLPEGEPVSLVAFVKKKGVIYQSTADYRIQKGKRQALEFSEISVNELNRMFGRNIRT